MNSHGKGETHPSSAWLDNCGASNYRPTIRCYRSFQGAVSRGPAPPMLYIHPGSSLSSVNPRRCHAIKALFRRSNTCVCD
jgi:hypothetical protein